MLRSVFDLLEWDVLNFIFDLFGGGVGVNDKDGEEEDTSSFL